MTDTRWDPVGMRELAGVLVATTNELRVHGSETTLVLGAVGRELPVERALVRTALWVEGAAVDLTYRADALELADRTIRSDFGLGITIEISYDTLMGTTTHEIAELQAWLAAPGPTTTDEIVDATLRLRELQKQRVEELMLLSMVAPSTHYRDELAELVDLLGYDASTIQAVIGAVAEGRSPAESGLPPELFPPGYAQAYDMTVQPVLDEISALEAQIDARLAKLDAIWDAIDDGASYEEIITEFGEWPIGVDVELYEARRDLEDAHGALDDVRDGLAKDELDTISWLVSSPLPEELVGPAVGGLLAGRVLDDPRDLVPIASILDDAASPTLDAAFYNHLGADGAAMIPTWIAAGMDYDHDRSAEARARLQSYSASLARALEEGVGFSGADLMSGAYYDRNVHPAELLRMAEFPDEFLIDAAVVLIHEHDGPVVIFPPSIMFASEPELFSDPRLIVLSQLATPGGSAALIAELEERGLVPELLDPYSPYQDLGFVAGELMAAARTNDAALAALIQAIGGVDELPPGVAIGGVALLDGNMALLIPTGVDWDPATGDYTGINRHDYDFDARVGTIISEADVDAFLETLAQNDTAIALLVNDFGAFARAQLDATPPEDMQDAVAELGAVAGRIIRIRNDVLIEQGADEDARTEFAGSVVSVVSGVLVGVATGGVGSAVLALGAGAAGDVLTDIGYDRLFPSDSEVAALRAALGDDTFDLEVWQYMTVAAIWESHPEFFGQHPPPTEIDGTLTSLTGPTISDEACFPENPNAAAEFYEWLNSLPDEMYEQISAIADTANSRAAEERRPHPED